MTATEIFNEIQTRAKNASAIGSTLKFSFGENNIFLDGNGDENIVSMEDKEADCTIKISEENLGKLLNGKLNPMMAFTMGQVKVEGDLGVAMKLQTLM